MIKKPSWKRGFLSCTVNLGKDCTTKTSYYDTANIYQCITINIQKYTKY